MGRFRSPLARSHAIWILVWSVLLAGAGPLAAQTLDETIRQLREQQQGEQGDPAPSDSQQVETGQQPRQGTPSRPFTEVIDVLAVQVEAVVTAKNGDRVPGLTRDDFRLLVDGEEAEIDYFEEVRRGVTITEGARTILAEAGGAEPGAEPTVTEEQMEGRDLLVFIDDYFTNTGTRRRLLKNFAGNLENLGPKDRMAIVRYAGWGLETRSGWSSSREELEAVIEELRKEDPGDLTRDSELDSMTDSTLGIDDEKLAEQRGVTQIQEVIAAMGVAMRTFSEGEGRKLFIPVTTGWNFDPTRGSAGAMDLATAELARDGSLSQAAPPLGYLNASGAPTPAGRTELPRQGEQAMVFGDSLLSPLIDTANLLGFSIYPMHLGRANPDDIQRTSLWVVALETGGRIATEGGAGIEPLAPVMADTGSYYVLGFSPDRDFDDRRHMIEVEMRQPDGAKIRHRRSFVDLSQQTQKAMENESLVYMDGEGGDLAVTLGEVRAKGKNLDVPVVVSIPMDWVTMVPQTAGSDQYVGDLELRIAAMDSTGRRSDTTVVPVQLSGPEPPPGSVATYETVIKIRKAEEQRLVIYLYDRLSGASKVAALELDG